MNVPKKLLYTQKHCKKRVLSVSVQKRTLYNGYSVLVHLLSVRHQSYPGGFVIEVNQVNDLNEIQNSTLRSRAERAQSGRTLEFIAKCDG